MQHITSFKADSHNAPVALYDCATIRKIESKLIEQLQSDETSLMKCAGYSLFRLIRACYPHAQHVWVAAGAGNNGGDGIEAAVWLHKAGIQVDVNWLGSPKQMSIDTAQALLAAQNSGLKLKTNKYGIQNIPPSVDLIIDGLLGIGLNPERPFGSKIEHFITDINQHSAPVVSIDIPSGLIADTGRALPYCVHADVTLTFLAAKPGLFTSDGREYCGNIWLDPLVERSVSDSYTPVAYFNHTHDCHALTNHYTKRAYNTHKGSFGDVAVVGGASNMTGAAILASRAAIAAGAGRVYTSLLTSQGDYAALSLDIEHPELMFRPFDQINLRQCTIACGCGGGEYIEDMLPAILKQAPRLLLDADALNAISAFEDLQKLLEQRITVRPTTVITPHPLEAARLLETNTPDIQAHRLEAAQELAQRFQCICVLKGSGTIIAAPECSAIINSSGNAALATAGTGDVLAGWIAGHWSGLQKLSVVELQNLVAYCVWTHGYAANRWESERNNRCTRSAVPAITASQLIQWL